MTSARTDPMPRCVAVLGCRVRFSRTGEARGVFGRRTCEGARAWRASSGGGAILDAGLVVASGGRAWDGRVEADAIRDELVRLGVDPGAIVRERASHSTADNARYTAELLARRGIDEVIVVTCDWHMARARAAFERAGLRVVPWPAVSPPSSWLRRTYRTIRERVAARLAPGIVLLAAASAVSLPAISACHKNAPPSGASADAAPPRSTADVAADLLAIARAEDERRAGDVPEAARTDRDPRLRRRAARAFARIADDASIPALLRALTDEDREVTAWGAYGLGATCKGHEEAHVTALAARAASLGGGPKEDASEPIDPQTAIARAVGRCGGARGEELLAGWVRARGPWSERAAYALGDFSARHGGLTDETLTVLLDAARGGAAGPQVPSALYPIGRLARVSDAFAPRTIEAARAALGAPSPSRIFAVRALGRSGAGAAADLMKAVENPALSPAERAEAAHGLARLDAAGRQGAGDALGRLVPARDPFALVQVGGETFGVLRALIDVVDADVPRSAQPALAALTRVSGTGNVPAPLARRLADVRCAAAAALASGAYTNDALAACDAKDSAAWQRGRLTSILRRPLVGARRAAWLEIARGAAVSTPTTPSSLLRVREAAIEAIAKHPELDDAARTALLAALHAPEAGLVGTAADVLAAHPDRAQVLAARERRAALDPAAPPPSGAAARDVDPAIARALAEAIARPWPEDRIETRAALMDAAVALGIPAARPAATAACHDTNATMRQRGQKALAALGDAQPSCPPPSIAPVAPEVDAPLTADAKLTFDTDVGALVIHLRRELAPVTSARLAALARSGFFRGVVVHRVVPGFVVQLGDPVGDGYGGSGKLLRCETSPVPFEALDVGMALAGRDTGSSQFFVTLSRTPHLDGDYAWVGRAEGGWAAVVEGDVVHEVTVENEP